MRQPEAAASFRARESTQKRHNEPERRRNILTMNDSQDHHYTPQFLLRGWCNKNGRLTVYSRRQGRVVTSDLNPRSTGFETNLYRYNQGPLEKRHTIETDFMTPHIDTPAASIVKKILNREWHKLTRDERSRFAYFILSLLARHPDAVALGMAGLSETVDPAPSKTVSLGFMTDPQIQAMMYKLRADPKTCYVW